MKKTFVRLLLYHSNHSKFCPEKHFLVCYITLWSWLLSLWSDPGRVKAVDK